LSAIAEIAQEEDKLGIVRGSAVSDYLQLLALQRQPAALRNADKEARQPVGKRVAEQEEVTRL
jgi:hypothetical protein